jgi:glucose dehydrogenase
MVVRRAEDLVETDMRGTDVAHALLVRDLFAAAVQQGMAFPPSAASW